MSQLAAGLFPFLCSLLIGFNILQSLDNRSELGRIPLEWDGITYDSVAFEMAYNGRFRIGESQQFLELYRAEGVPLSGVHFMPGVDEIRAYTPPLLPTLIAISYKVFGHDYIPVRVALVSIFCVGCLICLIIMNRLCGALGVYCAALLLFTDPIISPIIDGIMTEAIAFTVMAMIFLMTISAMRTLEPSAFMLVGLLHGFGFYVRTIFIIQGLVFSGVTFALLLATHHPLKASLKVCLSFLLAMILVAAPWMIRNCLVLEGFAPLGSQGGLALAAAFSDQVIETEGVWPSLHFDILQEYEAIPSSQKSEIDLHRYAQSKAFAWLLENYRKLPELAVLKVKAMFWPTTVHYRWIVFFALLGLFYAFQHRALFRASIVLIFVHLTISILTYSEPIGRFLFPLSPILYCLSALLVASLIERVVRSVNEDFSKITNRS